jgi:hypothetical protein
MWIKPLYPPLARMPSMRPQPTATARVEIKRKPPAAPAAPAPQAAPGAPPLSEEEEERARAGGFHESSYELKAGMDMLETDWPDDTTIPGALGDS